MNHDEKTTEIEIPVATPKSNIVKVDFAARGARASAPANLAESAPVVPMPPQASVVEPSSPAWSADLDIRSPWVLRLLAVVFVLLLSMLVL